MNALRLLLVRHGETESNVRHVLDSRPPGPPLNEVGERQADELALRLADEPVVAVYASTAIRAQQTAEPLARRHGLAVRVLDGVHEVGLGDLEGRSDQAAVEVFVSVYRPWTKGDLSPAMPGGETGYEVLARCGAAVDKIVAEHRSGTVVLVSHGGTIRLLAESMADNVTAALADAGLIPNTGCVVLTRDDDGWHCLEWTGVRL